MSTEIDFVLLIVVLFAVFLPVTAKFPGIFLFLQVATLRFSLFYFFFSLCTTLAADKDVVSLFFALLLFSLSIVSVAASYAHLASRGVSTNPDVVVIRKIEKNIIPELEITT